MLFLGLFCLFFVATTTSYPYNPFCQSGCQGQRFQPPPQQNCGSSCGGSWGGYWGGNRGGCGSCCQQGCRPPLRPPFYPGPPGPVAPLPVWPQQPQFPYYPPTNADPIRVVVGPPILQHPIHWVCPADPSPRAGAIYNSDDVLVACEYDENCPSSSRRQKCCEDSGVGRKVCKAAVQV